MQITRRSFLLGLGMGAFAGSVRPPLVFARETARNVVSVAQYGALPNGSDAGPGVSKAIAALPRTGGATLLFPPGRYHFRQHGGYAILLDGIDHLTLDGTGATFLFEGNTSPMRILNCEQPLFHGFTIDLDRPPFSQGEVEAVNHGARTADIRLNPGYPVTGTETVGALDTYDRNTGLFSNHGVDVYNIVDTVSPLGPDAIRLHFKWQLPQLAPGATVVLRHNIYGNPAISIGLCNSAIFQDIQIHAAAGMGVIGAKNNNMTFNRFRIQPAPGTQRMMSTNSDGVHIMNCEGRITLTDCLMSGMGDDCVNVTTPFLQLVERIDARTAVVAKFDKTPFKPADLVRVGFPVTLLSGHTLDKLGEVTVVGAEGVQKETLHFSGNLPDDMRPGDLLADKSHMPALTVSRCNFPGHRGRGVVAHTDAVIEGCRFSSQTNEAVLLMPEIQYTGEGPSVSNVRVINNEMDYSWRQGAPASGRASGAIRVSANAPAGFVPGLVDHDIEISDNTIARSGAHGIVCNFTQRFVISKNRLEGISGAALSMQEVRGGTVTGNICSPPRPVLIDPGSRSSVSFQGNVGLMA